MPIARIGLDFIVNSTTAFTQGLPAITALADGRFVATWTSLDVADGSGSCVRARVLNGDGTPAGADFVVNTTKTGNQEYPAITALADGRFVATWTSHDPADGSGSCVRARVFNGDGTPAAADFVVNTTMAANQSNPAITAFADGRFLATWDSEDPGDGEFGCIRGRVFGADGTPAAADFIVNSTIAGSPFIPSIATLADGRFVAAWSSDDTGDGSFSCVRARVFGADGAPTGEDFIVNSTTTSFQNDPSITVLADGRFVIVWSSEDTGDGSLSCVRARVFNADGTPAAVDFIVNSTTTSYQHSPSVTALPDGRFVVALTSEDTGDGSLNCVRAQIFDPNTFNGTDAGDIWQGSNLFADHIHGGAGADTLSGRGGGDVIKGGGGDDVLNGGVGNDTLDGGDGADTAILSGARSAYTLRRSGSTIQVSGPDGVDTLSNIETAVFSDGAVSLANQSPVVTSNGGGDAATAVISENSTAVRTVTATDPNGDLITYSIVGGADAARFRIDAVTGAVSFVTAPDFEAPADADLDNSYVVTVRASDGALFDDQTIAVKVLDDLSELGVVYGSAGNDLLSGGPRNDIIFGEAGDDVISGDAGDDGIDGGPGDDTAVFSGGLGNYTIQDFGSRIVVSGSDGTDTLTSIEHLKFADATLDVTDDGNPLFDTLFYLSRNTDVYFAGVNALDHFNAHGRYEGRDPNAFFDTSGYLAVNKDVAAAGVNPLDHYHQSGWYEGRDPSAWFDTTLYLINNPDVAAAGIDPLAHFLANGFSEGRAAYAAVGQTVGGFDAQHYLFRNPDVAAAGIDPLLHFNVVGWKEGRDPNACFDTDGYLAHYADVAAAGINPLQHYEAVGWKEGRDPSGAFDTAGYLAAYSDVAAADIDPLQHFLQFGIYEGRASFGDGVLQ
jgi:hypothetical protein